MSDDELGRWWRAAHYIGLVESPRLRKTRSEFALVVVAGVLPLVVAHVAGGVHKHFGRVAFWLVVTWFIIGCILAMLRRRAHPDRTRLDPRA